MVVVKSVMKTVVIMVIRVEPYILAREMKRGMTIEYLKCRADLNFEVDIGVNGAIGAIVTKWKPLLFGKWIVFIHNTIYFIFFNTLLVPLIILRWNLMHA